jgi:hypothetical protein
MHRLYIPTNFNPVVVVIVSVVAVTLVERNVQQLSTPAAWYWLDHDLNRMWQAKGI